MGAHQGKHRTNRTERVKRKTIICILGFLLLGFLLAGNVSRRFGKSRESGAEEPLLRHRPTVEVLHNVWLMEIGEQDLLVYRDGAEERYGYGLVEEKRETEQGILSELRIYQPQAAQGGQVADVELTDGLVTNVRVKGERIRGAVLGVGENAVEVEGYGIVKLAEGVQGYRFYGTLGMCGPKDLVIGYDFADFVMDGGEICAILMVREETIKDLRVLIKTADYGANLHQELVLSADTDFAIRYGDVTEEHAAGDEVIITCGSAYFQSGRILAEPSVKTGRIVLKNVTRSQGIPSYRGCLELVEEEEGFAVINIVPLEEYLYSVVPSEMPSSYPKEALKAQAICARTYAYGHVKNAAYPALGAHVDDSTSYQVYNNVAEQESTTTAVKETGGKLLYTPEGEPAGTYYYSTSCGVGSDANVWKTEEAKNIGYLKACSINPKSLRAGQSDEIGEYLREEVHFAAFIRTVDPEDYEAQEGWYRWSYQVKEIDPVRIGMALQKRYRAKPELVLTLQDEEYVSREIEDITEIHEIYVASRLPGGVADELIIVADSGTYKVISEHNIRAVLCDGETKVKRQNGSEAAMPNLLPSGFFIIETGKKQGNVIGYTLTGGGFGHGVGMSQNAAKAMAARGMTCEEILLFFYRECVIF